MKPPDDNREKKIGDLTSLFHQGDMKVVVTEAVKLSKELNSATVYNILALAHKKLGNQVLAQNIYEELLVKNPLNSLFLGNLGNIFNETGKLDKAEECFKKCLQIDEKNYNVSIGLADIYVKKSKLGDALNIYEIILEKDEKLTLDQLSDINFRIAEIYRTKGTAYIEQAIKHYGRSDKTLSSALRLELIYRSKDKLTFYEAEKEVIEAGELNPLLAAVQTHASIKYDKPDKNLFCKDSFKFIHHSKLTLKEGFNDDLIERILKVKNSLDAVSQVLLNNGEQSAGNIFLSEDPSVQIIKNIIINRIEKYRAQYSGSSEGFIKKWPDHTSLYGWIIELKHGGSLNSHMHKLGWLSGSLYLKLKKPLGSRQGNIIFDLDGANYPNGSKFYPSKEYNIEKGDIVLFPSSIFHKTVPFESQENRVTLAFDIKPTY